MVTVNCKKNIKQIKRFWNGIHFHPTDAIEDDWGREILDDVAADRVADTVRIYAMLEDIVTMDSEGKLCYDFTLNDIRMDYMVEKGFKLLVSYNFMPACLASDTEVTCVMAKNKTRYKGKVIITSAPTDFSLWEEVCYEYTKHIVERYGLETVSGWYLECWNEPDTHPFFMGVLDDDNRGAKTRIDTYTRLYGCFASGISRVSEKLCVGGPGLSMYVHFLDGFLKNVREQKIPLKFVSVHAYGTEPGKINSGKQPLNSNDPVRKFAELESTVKKYFDSAEIIVDEWGASSGGFIDREKCPGIMFREDSIMPVFMAKMVKAYIDSERRIDKLMICLSGQHEMKVDFSGFRSLFTLNHIKKPIYNAYVLFDKVYENLLESFCDNEDMQIIATKGEGVSVMIAYASENFNENLPPLNEKICFEGLEGKHKVTLWLIDETHTNPYRLALRNGWGDGEYTAEQIAVLKEEGIMKPSDIYEKDFSADNTVEINFSNNALVLVEVE